MATRKTAEPVVDEQTEKEEAEAVKEPEVPNPWDIKVPMLVPRKHKGDDQNYYVCVNDRRFYIPADGKVQELPQPIAEALNNALNAEFEAEEYADKVPNRSAESGAIL